jgi:hypothetical protein
MELAEVPATWGLLEIANGRARVAKEAPDLNPIPPTWAFVAACLRREAGAGDNRLQAAREAGYKQAAEQFDADAVERINEELDNTKRQLRRVQCDLESYQAVCSDFEAKTGINLGNAVHHWGGAAQCVELAKFLTAIRGAPLATIATQLEQAASHLRAAEAATGGAASGQVVPYG